MQNSKVFAFLLLLTFTLLYHGFAGGQKPTARILNNKNAMLPDSASFLSREPRDVFRDHCKFRSCNISVRIQPVPPVLRLGEVTKSNTNSDTMSKFVLRLNIQNLGNDTCFFPDLFGKPFDYSLIYLLLYKKQKDKYILKHDAEIYDDITFAEFAVSLYPGEKRSTFRKLYRFFKIDSVGSYKIGGYFKTNCNCKVELNKIEDVYFKVNN